MLFSILITSFNSENFVEDCVHSVLGQIGRDCEILVVDDFSVDSTTNILKSFLEYESIKVFFNEKNYGQAHSLNRAFAASVGKYILPLDSDDLFHPDKLSHLRKYIEKESAGFIQHDLIEIDQDGVNLGTRFGVNTSATGCKLYSGDVLSQILSEDNPYSWYFAPTSGLCLRRDYAEKIFPLPTEFRICADVPIAYYSAAMGNVGLIGEPLGFYRLHSSSGYASQVFANKNAWKAEQFINTLERYSLLLDAKNQGLFPSLKDRALPDLKAYERFWEFYYRFVYPCRRSAALELFRRRMHAYRIGEVDFWYVMSKFLDDLAALLRSSQVDNAREAFYARFHRLSYTSRLLLSEH
jgi:glycosyltransferase involved in cell wall biosynthesis